MAQLADFFALSKPRRKQEAGNFRAPTAGSLRFALGGVAKDFADLFLDAPAVALGATGEFVVDFIFQLPNYELRHLPADMMISPERDTDIQRYFRRGLRPAFLTPRRKTDTEY